MDRHQLGSVLRMVGPLIQIGFLSFLLRQGRESTILGLPAEGVIWGGFIFGFALSATGVLLSRIGRRPPQKSSDDFDRPLNL